MAVLKVSYDDRDFLLDIEDMDTDDARAMERFGVPNLKAFEDGVSAGDTSALTVAYWLMLKQNGEPGARIERVKFKPIKLIKALIAATQEAADGEPSEEGKAPES